MSSIRTFDPFRCRMWQMHDRLEMNVSEESCKSEISSFEKHGQLIPALGRLLKMDGSYDVELIYGARRLFVARLLKMPLKVEVREMTDREAIIAMDIENRQRTDISPYERGMGYSLWLREGHFQSQDDIARTLKISASQVSRLLKIARLPSVIVQSFPAASDICEGWGLELIEALDDASRRQRVIDMARSIARAEVKPSPREVYRQLMSAAADTGLKKAQAQDEVVRGDSGAPLFRIRHQSKLVALVLPQEKVSPARMAKISKAVAELLEQNSAASGQDADAFDLTSLVLEESNDTHRSFLARSRASELPAG